KEKGRLVRYEAKDITPDMSFLEMLDVLNEELIRKGEDPIAFDHDCREGICGMCAQVINGIPQGPQKKTTVCQLHMRHFKNGDIIYIEPLRARAFPVIRDLIVDMSRFFEYYRFIDPVFAPAGPDPERERTMTPAAARDLHTYTACILCGACFGACPVNARDPHYLGPAALAALYRFRIDPREGRGIERLSRADTPEGWWACEFHGNCRRVCPKGVPPNVAIGKARQELTAAKRGTPMAGGEKR
ncbi:MAG TPA: 2Fe-2S iron-sulfur cluster-binding protein, partial [Methanomicrobiales archaeon]|nr:2Fe-2S iron-sulfur cluster-binding protein [Methanomicrobiales archaeon]